MDSESKITGRPYPHELDRYGYGGGPDDCPKCGAMSPDYCPKVECEWDSGDSTSGRDGQHLGSAARKLETHVAPSAPITGSGQAQTTPIRSGWRFWLVIAFLAPIALVLWIKDVTHGQA